MTLKVDIIDEESNTEYCAQEISCSDIPIKLASESNRQC